MIESIINENVLIDQIVLNNIIIKDIYDIDFLAKEGIIKVNKHPPYYYVGQGKAFSHLSIKGDGMIVSMRAGVLSQRGLPIPFCFMTLSVPEDPLHKNLHCLSIKDYKVYIRSIQNHLFTRYGIDIWKTDHIMKSVYTETFSEERTKVDDVIDGYFESML